MGLLGKALVGVGAVVVLIALVVVAFLLGFLGAPSGGVEDVGEWETVTENRTEVVTTLWADNPNPVGISLASGVSAEYELYMNDVAVANGSKEGIEIAPGNNTLQLSTDIRNRKLEDWWVGFVRANETIPFRVNASADIDAGPVSTSFRFPTFERTMLSNSTPIVDSLSGVVGDAEGNYTESVPADRLSSTAFGSLVGAFGGTEGSATVGYQVRRGWARWGTVSENRTELLLNLRVHNPSEVVPVPAEPDGVGVSIRTNDVALLNATGDDATLSNPGNFTSLEGFGGPVIAPNETRRVVYAVEIDNRRTDDWFRSHVRRGERTDLRAQFQLVFGVGDTEFRVPRGGPGAYECQFRTGILVDGQETSTDCRSGGRPAP